MNVIGLNCLVSKNRGKLLVVISADNGCIYSHIFESPSVFSFRDNSGEILNWHRENILSLISFYNVEAVVIKKTEILGIQGKKRDVFKLYLEGVLLSLAGSIGLRNSHFYTQNLNSILKKDMALSLEDLLIKHKKENKLSGILANEANDFKTLIQAVLAFESKL